MHKPAAYVNLCGLLHKLLHDREILPDVFNQRLRSSSWCQSHAAQLTTCGLLAGCPDWLPSWQFHAHCWKFPPIAILFHDFGSFCTNGVQPTSNSSTRTKWSTCVYDITFQCSRQRTTDWCNHPRKRNLVHPLLPYIGCMSNYPCPVTRAILEWLDIPIYAFQQRVSIINERNSVGMWKKGLLV